MNFSTKFGLLIFALLAFSPGANSAQVETKLKKVPNSISGEYIVVLKETTSGHLGQRSNAIKISKRLIGKHGGKSKEVYRHAISGFSATLTEAEALKISNDPDVEFVQEDAITYATATSPQLNPPSWGLDRIDQTSLPLNGSYSFGYQGSGVHAYVVDSGIRSTHTDFGGRVSLDFDAFGGNATDQFGHGTHVAGTIGGTSYGVAKLVNLHSIRVLDANGSGTDAGFISGLNWVIQNHVKPAIVNASLGFEGNQPNCVAKSLPAVDAAVNNVIAAGITVVVAAGNCNWSTLTTPATVAGAITVGATDIYDYRAGYSNFGSGLDLFAPGSSITSAWFNYDTDYNTIGGTSMATPHVAGVAALILQRNPAMSPANVHSTIVGNAAYGVVVNAGSGSPNLLLQTNTDPIISGQGKFDRNPRVLADVDGDGKADAILFADNAVFVALSNGTSFGVPQIWQTQFTYNSSWTSQDVYPRMVADVNGDGKADVIAFGSAGVYVALSNGSSFANAVLWNSGYGEGSSWSNQNTYPRFVEDVNGDGKADVVGIAGAGVYVSLSNGTSFGVPQLWNSQYGTNTTWTSQEVYPRAVADVNGDGKADIIGFGAGTVYVSLSSGSAFGSASAWTTNFTYNSSWVSQNNYPRILRDVNGDGLADIVGFSATGPQVALSNGSSFGAPSQWTTEFNSNNWISQDDYPRLLGRVTSSSKSCIVGFSTSGMQVSAPGTSSFGSSTVWSRSFGR